jgi:hypothetical protein
MSPSDWRSEGRIETGSSRDWANFSVGHVKGLGACGELGALRPILQQSVYRRGTPNGSATLPKRELKTAQVVDGGVRKGTSSACIVSGRFRCVPAPVECASDNYRL